jgi:glutamine amidotransferase
VRFSSDPVEIARADRVVLPGVGAAPAGMARLRELALVDCVRALRQPLLGVCLGMQLLFDASDEGDVDCLGLLPGRVRRITGAPGVRVPHMGWNTLEPLRDDALLRGIDPDRSAYFVHSYAAPVTDDTVAACTHGDRFAAVVRRGNRMGAQFHPERSARAGALLLENFLALSA